MKRRSYLWTILAASALSACSDSAGPAAPATPGAAQFITTDIDHFWQAYDAGGKDGSIAAFQSQYLGRASTGLRDFIQARAISAASLAQVVLAYPRYFAAVRANTLELTHNPALFETIRANYEKIESLYPAAIFPPVTLLFGRFSTAGTTGSSGMLIGIEFFAIDETTPLDELGAFQRANVKSADSLSLIIAHEHTHVLQQRAGKLYRKPNKTLLDQSLIEGSADFVGELVSGSHMDQHVYEWGLVHESELWDEFQRAMDGTNVSRWLYNQGSATPSRPGDLGYFIGYRITQAYYNRVADKAAALRQIIEVADANDFLVASGYAGSGP